MRYALDGGGKRIRPVICLATAEAAGGTVADALTAATALELVHTFSLVHDDLPSMDDDDERRGRPSTHVAFGEAVGLLAGDALLAESQRLALTYDRPEIARELAEATLGMIGGQYLDITGDDADLAALHRLKTGRLFAAAVGLGLWSARVPEPEQAPWRAFGEELGLLFQVVDDVLDGDGYAARIGDREARCARWRGRPRGRPRVSTRSQARSTSCDGIVTDLVGPHQLSAQPLATRDRSNAPAWERRVGDRYDVVSLGECVEEPGSVPATRIGEPHLRAALEDAVEDGGHAGPRCAPRRRGRQRARGRRRSDRAILARASRTARLRGRGRFAVAFS